MQKWMIVSTLLFTGLSGCATRSCDTSVQGSPCRADYLLYQNDMLQAKLWINERRQDNYELAGALLKRAALRDTTGEAQFYQAILLLRENAEDAQIDTMLRESADRRYPLAIALLAQRTASRDQEKALTYRSQYEDLDVSRSGYPSFTQALTVVNQLVLRQN